MPQANVDLELNCYMLFIIISFFSFKSAIQVFFDKKNSKKAATKKALLRELDVDREDH